MSQESSNAEHVLAVPERSPDVLWLLYARRHLLSVISQRCRSTPSDERCPFTAKLICKTTHRLTTTELWTIFHCMHPVNKSRVDASLWSVNKLGSAYRYLLRSVVLASSLEYIYLSLSYGEGIPALLSVQPDEAEIPSHPRTAATEEGGETVM